ncbi:MAG: hypothetical protein P8Z77_11940 [Candidatus Thiodiazotropha sp.]
MSASLFHSGEQFRQHFASGLRRMLETPALGGYILVHANASFDAMLFEQLRPLLLKSYEQLAEACRQRLCKGQELEGAADDASVFLKLMAIGFDGVQLTRFRSLNDWELQFNHLRAFRPSRMTGESVSGISRPFDATGFHFNKPFLRQEAIWSGELQGERVELLYNKFPFVPLHGLLVPDREAQHPQLLTRRYHDYVWRLCETLGNELPGWGVGYNSYGAYASVNHLHFQTFLSNAPLPVSRDGWSHNGGERPYPLPCEAFGDRDAGWRRIESLHAAGCSYNLIYQPGRLYCLPRRPQGSYETAPWSSGFAWYEVAGGFTTASVELFEKLDDTTIARELGRLNPSP